MQTNIQQQDWLNEIFPASRTDAFFDALFGGAEEGAYDIRLICRGVTAERLNMAFELRQRPGKCLACNLTYGLPQVFQRHPVLDVAGTARVLADAAGWQNLRWELGKTEEHSRELHIIPFTVYKA